MVDLQKIARKNILELKPYASARSEFSGNEGTFLDANENPFGMLNRYPDPMQVRLKHELSLLKGLPAENMFIGNGSDEVIDLMFRIFCNPTTDKALTFTPTYGMYEVSAAINNVDVLKLPLTNNFQIDTEGLPPYLADPTLKLIFICSPNNPTGNLLNAESIDYILARFSGIVFIDEAYIDFTDTTSWSEKLNRYPNLIVSQTLSKAWGLASIRVGIAYAHASIIDLMNKVKPPYNVSTLNQEAALYALKKVERFEENKQTIIKERKVLAEKLQKLPVVKKVYPSDANFLLVEVVDANATYAKLVERNVIVRNRHSVVTNCLRITVGSPIENSKLLEALATE